MYKVISFSLWGTSPHFLQGAIENAKIINTDLYMGWEARFYVSEDVDPKIIDFLDIDGIAKHLIRVLGIPAEVTKGEEEIAGIRYQRQQDQAKQQEQMKQMQDAEMMNKTAPALKALDGE